MTTLYTNQYLQFENFTKKSKVLLKLEQNGLNLKRYS